MAMLFGPKPHFYGVRCGRSEFSDGVIAFLKLHYLFSHYQRDLVPNGTEDETKNILSFFATLGTCRQLTELESTSFGVEENGFYEFPELTQISDLPFLPSESVPNHNHRTLCIMFDSMNHYLYSRLRKKLIPFKDPRYKSFLNSIILKRHQNMELWFQKEDKLYVVIRGGSPQTSLTDIAVILEVC